MLRALGRLAPAELRAISRLAGLNKVTTFRILGSLVSEGFASRPPETQLYDVGPELVVLTASQAGRVDLRAAARSSLSMLAARSGDAAVLSIRSGTEAVCIDRQTGTFPIQSNYLYPGTRRPLGVGAGATALLAALAPFEADALLDALGDRLGPFPNLSLPLIRDRVLEARRCGYALVTDLIVDRLGGIATAIHSPGGDVVGAFSILGLTERITGRIEELVALLKQAAGDTQQALLSIHGGPPADLDQGSRGVRRPAASPPSTPKTVPLT